MRFMGAAFQMAAVIGLFAWAGIWADENWNWAPWGTVGLTLLGVVLAMVWMIKQIHSTR
jgi:F0F1-type ATP synthase assembly protein I